MAIVFRFCMYIILCLFLYFTGYFKSFCEFPVLPFCPFKNIPHHIYCKLCRVFFFNVVNISNFTSLFALNFQMFFTIHYVAWFITRVRLEKTMRVRDGDCGGRLKSGVCADDRQRRLSFHGCLHHKSPCPPFFLLKKHTIKQQPVLFWLHNTCSLWPQNQTTLLRVWGRM